MPSRQTSTRNTAQPSSQTESKVRKPIESATLEQESRLPSALDLQPGSPLSPAQVHGLQHLSGNRAVGRLLAQRALEKQPPPGSDSETVMEELLPDLALAATQRSPADSTTPAAQAGKRARRAGQRTAQGLVQRFEAAHHEHVELGALTTPTAGGGPVFSDAEASATYFGNWQRDMNQAMGNNPITKALGKELVFEIINVLAMHKFGRQLNTKDFGVYSPREHIDNPAGQINADLLRKDQERRFTQSVDIPNKPEDISSVDAVNKMFVVSDAGLPAYLGRSIQFVEEEFSTAADKGRTEDGLMHLGSGLHTIEDLFAHSNFIEIAVGKLITGPNPEIKLDTDMQAEVKQRTDKGLDPVEIMSGRTAARQQGGATIPGRPILTTGTFTTDDTLISLAEAVTAFMNDFDPFGASNAERNQQVMTMILGRYESLSASGQAGQIVLPLLSTLGKQLSDEAAKAAQQAVSGEQPAPAAPGAAPAPGAAAANPPAAQPASAPAEQSLWDRAKSAVGGAASSVVAGARNLAGKVVGGAVSLAGNLLQNNWIQERIAGAINGIGSLPLVEIYKFTIDAAGKIKSFFTWLDGILQNVPGYTYLKNLIAGAKEALKARLKPLITGAVRFVGSLIQKSFSSAQAEGTYIQNQINQLVKDKVKDPTAQADLAKATTPEAKLALLANPEWGARAQLSDDDMERLRQMIQSPEYIKQGASHSQIAKDHADSPFFGTAAVLAGHAVSRVRDLMTAVWSAEKDPQGRSKNEQLDPKLRANYAGEIPPELASRLPPPGTPEAQMTPDQLKAQEEAQKAYHYKEIKRGQEGRRLLKDGALPEGEEEHGGEAGYELLVKAVKGSAAALQALNTPFRELALQLQNLAGGVDRASEKIQPQARALAAEMQSLAAELPRGIEDLAEQLEHAEDGKAMQNLAARLRRLATEKAGLVSRAQTALRQAADLARQAGPAGQALADKVRGLSAQLEPLAGVTVSVGGKQPLADLSKTFTQAAQTLEERGQRKVMSDQQLKDLHNLAPVKTGAWDKEFSESHARAESGKGMSPERQALFDFVRKDLLNHPYDTTWWKPVLIAWANANKARLEAYIRARNTGEMHHHE